MDSQLIISKESKADLKSTWKVYKTQWKTFAIITGFLILAYIIQSVIELILTGIGIATFAEFAYRDTGEIIIASIIRLPFSFVFSALIALLSVLYMAVPALYFENRELITPKVPFLLLKEKFGRIILGGLLYSIAVSLGYVLCIIPGIAISFIGPAFTNKIVTSDTPIIKAFSSSFQAVFKSPNLWSYIGMTILASLIFGIATICGCGISSIVTVPMIGIYSQHLAYNKGILN